VVCKERSRGLLSFHLERRRPWGIHLWQPPEGRVEGRWSQALLTGAWKKGKRQWSGGVAKELLTPEPWRRVPYSQAVKFPASEIFKI